MPALVGLSTGLVLWWTRAHYDGISSSATAGDKEFVFGVLIVTIFTVLSASIIRGQSKASRLVRGTWPLIEIVMLVLMLLYLRADFDLWWVDWPDWMEALFGDW